MGKSDFIRIINKKKLMLPPLSGYTDFPYRRILAKFNPPFISTEMVNAKAVIHKNKQTMKMVEKIKGSHFSGVQLLGKDPELMKCAAIIIEDLGFDYIDVNMGCTVRKVVTKGEGVSLMKNEDLAYKIVKKISGAVNIPVTVKLRTGLSKDCKNVVSLSKRLEKADASAITVHGRSGEKKFSSQIDYDIIKETAESIAIPVVANGGIFSAYDAKNILYNTKASAVMPGRGIIGNPWLISEILCHFSKKSYKPPSLLERKKLCIEHVKNSCIYYGDRNGICKMRKMVHRYFPLTKNLKFLKNDMQKVSTVDDIYLILSRIIEIDDRIMYDFN